MFLVGKVIKENEQITEVVVEEAIYPPQRSSNRSVEDLWSVNDVHQVDPAFVQRLSVPSVVADFSTAVSAALNWHVNLGERLRSALGVVKAPVVSRG